MERPYKLYNNSKIYESDELYDMLDSKTYFEKD